MRRPPKTPGRRDETNTQQVPERGDMANENKISEQTIEDTEKETEVTESTNKQ